MAKAVLQIAGVVLLPIKMFSRELQQGRLVKLFDIEIAGGRYWLTRFKSKQMTPVMKSFLDWLRKTTTA